MENCLTNSDINFLNNIAFSNSGSVILYFTEQEIKDIVLTLSVFDRVTLNDVLTYVHVHDFPHEKYLNLFASLFLNPPIDLNTFIIKGENISKDINIYNDSTVDVILWYQNNGPSIFEVIHLLWKKLKCNGTIIVKGIKEDDEACKLQLKFFFSTVINLPTGILVEIMYINDINTVTIRKPCY